MTRKLFFWWTKTKRCWISCTFPYKGSKNSQVIIILRKFVREDLISVISFLSDRHSIYICSNTGFRATDYLPPPPRCANTPLSYIVQNMWAHIQAKAFVGTRGGGTICHKTFPNFYMFHCKKKTQSKIKSLQHSKRETYSIIIKYWIQGNVSAKQ